MRFGGSVRVRDEVLGATRSVNRSRNIWRSPLRAAVDVDESCSCR